MRLESERCSDRAAVAIMELVFRDLGWHVGREATYDHELSNRLADVVLTQLLGDSVRGQFRRAEVLAFSETVRAGHGSLELWPTNDSSGALAAVVDVSALAHGSGQGFIIGKHVILSPSNLVAGVRYRLLASDAGVLRDTVGNELAALDTAGSWEFTTLQNDTLDVTAPEVAFVGEVQVGSDGLARGVVYFTEGIVAGQGVISVGDCGMDLDCGGALGSPQEYGGPGADDNATVALGYGNGSAVGLDNGVLSFTWSPKYLNRRYLVSVPSGFVRDTSAAANPGPSADFEFVVDVGDVPTAQPTYHIAPPGWETCSGSTEAYLATSCGDGHLWSGTPAGTTGLSTAVAALDGSGSLFQLRLDASGLAGGRHYRICVDLDGPDGALVFGDSGIRAYVSPVASVQAFVRGALGTPPRLPSTLARFNYTAVTSAGDVGDPAGDVGDPNGDVGDPNASNSSNATNSTDNLTNLTEDAPTPVPVVVVQVAVPLVANNTTAEVNISTVAAEEEARPVELALVCGSGCSASGHVYLAARCERGEVAAGSESTRPGGLVPQDPGLGSGSSSRTSAFSAVLDVAPLEIGRTYRLCYDADGVGGSMEAGDTGLLVHTSPLRGVEPGSLNAAPGQEIRVVCEENAVCTASTTAYLSREACDVEQFDGSASQSGALRTGSAAFVPDGPAGSNAFRVVVDASSLDAGVHYKLCVDLDGRLPQFSFGASASVYVSGITGTSSPSLSAASPTTLTLDCPVGCSTASLVSVALECSGDGALAAASVPGVRASAVRLGAAGARFTAAVDAGGLTLGASYKLCADLDGVGGEMVLGDTGVRLYVAPPSESGSADPA
ncbi:unnamed protein product [Prorocentrum cordatum]|uniref:SbsA Ig-like domain-containing protein n=1 Tax=Prorocentrum cordatum TaxID=2364126 RepID=A0ABN9SSQ8_9DINO|nr:unnamed protein product [Polarella glacialis]